MQMSIFSLLYCRLRSGGESRIGSAGGSIIIVAVNFATNTFVISCIFILSLKGWGTLLWVAKKERLELYSS